MRDFYVPAEIFRRQTILASTCVKAHLKPGDSAIDGTAGTGADTLMMASAVGNGGKIYAFDIQKDAEKQTIQLLKEAKLTNCLRFYLRSHAQMKDVEEITQDRNIRAVMFNLGFMPGGNHSIMTQTETTLSAVSQALDLMANDGVMTICTYRHPEGEKERQAVDYFCKRLGKGIDVHKIETLNHEKSPVLYLIYKRG